MDPVMLRNQALQVAMMRAKLNSSLQKVMADAETVLTWLKADGTGSGASTQTGEPSKQYTSSTTHESQAAVEGQEPKGD